MATESCRLYLITPPRIDVADFAEDLARALDGGDVACVQLRLKEAADDDIRRAAEALLAVTRERGVELLMNDRPDLARETGCDGVHVGQQDATYEAARQAVGAEGVVGVTCHGSRDLAVEAAAKGADYVALGAFYPTDTKEAKARAEPDILAWWSEMTTVPSVAIGGITPANCPPLVRAGADFLAVVAAVWNHPDGPAQAVKALEKAIAEAPESE
ncbi:MAG: thiamine phosphate synthase [Rhodospirillales bacterium]|jgi:thiamine-phosphate pyrophosphorylase|nr:thiamine phosphate synthase [Rhodospirillales bacterium]